MGQSINRQIKRLEKHPGEFQKFNEFISSYSGEDLTDLGYDVEIQKDDFSIDDDKKYLFWFWQNRKKIFVDRTVLQRLLSVWDDERANSNLSHYLAGSTGKDLIQLALIKPIVEGLLVQIDLADEEEEKDILEALKENYEHFKEILEDGYEYLLLDGQHRLDRVNAYFNNELHFSWTNGWSDTSIKVKGHRLKLTGRWNDLDDLAKIYVSTIRIPTTIYSSSNIKLLKMIMSDSNHNQPMSHHERRSIVSNSVAGRFLTNLFYDVKFEKSGLLSPEWVEFWERIKGMSSDYQLSKKGPTLLATHLLNYMINSKGSTGGYRWTVEEDDALYADSSPVNKVDRKKFTRYMMIITRAILSRPISPKVSRGSLIDLFLFLHGIENVFHGRKYSISRNVEKQIELVDKFIEQQTERLTRNRWIMGVDGIKKENKECFFEWHRSTWDVVIKKRFNMIKDDFEDSVNEFLQMKWIVPTGSRQSALTTAEVWVNNDGKLFDGTEISLRQAMGMEINEKTLVSEGGQRTLENTDLRTSKSNKQHYNQTRNV